MATCRIEDAEERIQLKNSNNEKTENSPTEHNIIVRGQKKKTQSFGDMGDMHN
jgi:hypothetical protein